MASFVDGVTAAMAGNKVSKSISGAGRMYMHVGKIIGNTFHIILSTSTSLPPSVDRRFKTNVKGSVSAVTRFLITTTEDMWGNYKGRVILRGDKANSHPVFGGDGWTY
jgi:hypothetical protein